MLETKSDREIFQKLYQEKAKNLYFVARRIVTNEADAEEAVYGCFSKLSENFAKYRKLPYEKLANVCRFMVKNEARKLAGSDDRHSCSGGGKADNIGLDATDDLAEHNGVQMEDIWKTLDEGEQDILYMRYVLDLKVSEISELTDIEPATVKEKILACENKIAAILEEQKIWADAVKRK